MPEMRLELLSQGCEVCEHPLGTDGILREGFHFVTSHESIKAII